MKKIILMILMVAFVLVSCNDKESMGVSTVTTYATLNLKGSSSMFWAMNTPFVDPGIVALEGSTDISSSIIIDSNIDVSKGGKYSINYKVKNADGFWATTSREVIVYDKNAPLNGIYKSNIKRSNAGAIANRGAYDILVFGIGDNTYNIYDLLGGWYSIGSNYGDAYAGTATIKLNADNTFTILTSKKLAWGYPVLFTAPSTYDAATKTILLNTRMEDVATMLFTVTLTNPTPLK